MMLLLSAGCSREQSQAVLSSNSLIPSRKSASEPGSEKLHIAIISDQSSQKQTQQLKALSKYLEKSIGYKFDIQPQKDYETIVNLLVTEKIQIAYLDPFIYVKAKEKNIQIEPMVAPMTKVTGRPWHTSMIIANSTRIKTVKELQKKRFGFINKSSTIGFIIPSIELFEPAGIEPEKTFSEIKFLDSGEQAIAALIAGEVDAVAVAQETYVKAQQEQKLDPAKYVKIWESSPFPTAPIVISNKLDPGLINDIKKALIDAPAEIVAISGVETAGYTLVDNLNYEPIKKLQSKLD
ncbi:phosphate/phosphite/phosphonate ABC transporter substrate-binding protein [Anabaena azotica]|uniref:phosphate/phosphite/phosphonate ABC transporter substrate-binding protein n=1 Tax=Anabaena azotica TaxID=197653 RepID=UPI0039A41B21